MILQFVSQRHRPVRGGTLKMVLNYIRNYPCKASLTAAGCYLCAAPGSKGTKILVCCSPDSPKPSRIGLTNKYFIKGQEHCQPNEIEQIIMKAKECSDRLLLDVLDVPFLHATSCEFILNEGRKQKFMSDSTYESILLLQKEESKQFSTLREQTESEIYKENLNWSMNTSIYEVKHTSGEREIIHAGELCHFMSRFFIWWERDTCEETMMFGHSADESNCDWELKNSRQRFMCARCVIGCDRIAVVRNMVDADWLYLAKLSNGERPENSLKETRSSSPEITEQREFSTITCLEYAKSSALKALESLKSIPASARRGLPVLVDPQGLLLSIPGISFKHCPCLIVHAIYQPRVPVGGGYTSYV